MEEIKNSKYFQYLFDNHEELFEHHRTFSKEMHGLLSKNTEILGTVLKCHLILENFIDRLLLVGYPTISWDKANLTFSKKLEIVNTPGTSIGAVYYRSLKELNSLRNKFAHKITYQLQDIDILEIKKSTDLWNKLLKKDCTSGIHLIEEFTIWICANIDSLITGINKHAPVTGLAGYLEWLKEMQNPKD